MLLLNRLLDHWESKLCEVAKPQAVFLNPSLLPDPGQMEKRRALVAELKKMKDEEPNEA